jgi:tetratricopeptide (TPR) repeat protein
MKKAVIIGFLAFATAACANSAQTVTQQTPDANNSNVSTAKNTDSLVTSSHSTDKTPGAQNGAPKTQTESPMAKAIDVSEFTTNIEKAEKDYKAKQTDAKAKETLAEAYFTRAFALTEAAQYRAALGDFRKGLKLNSKNEDARAMHDRIISIFKSINREPPKEGEEPSPMPFNKGS